MKWWNPFQKKRPPQHTDEEFARAQTLHDAWKAVENSRLFGVLKEEIGDQLRIAMAQLSAGNLSHVDYARLAGRVEVLMWLASLPEQKVAHYTDLAERAAEAERPPRPEVDGPVQWDDV